MIVMLHSVIAAGMSEEYERRHATIPEGLVATFDRIGIRSWSIWRSGEHLFHRVECDDWETANAALSDDSANAAWQEFIGPLVVGFAQPGGDGPQGQVLPQVWDLERQRAEAAGSTDKVPPAARDGGR